MTNTIENTTLIADLDDAVIVAFIRDFVGKTTIATLDFDDDDKVIKETFDLDLSNFPLNAFAKYLSYGMQRVFNDAVGGADKWDSTDQKLDAVRNHIFEFENGIVKKSRTAGPAITDAAKLARVGARKAVKAQYAATAGKDYKDDFLSLTPAAQNETLDAVIAANPVFIEQAQAEIDARSSVVIDLSTI